MPAILASLICRGDELTNYWTLFTRTLSHYLSSPALTLALLITFVTLTLISSSFRRNHRYVKGWIVSGLSGLLILSLLLPLVGQALLVSLLPADSGEPVQAIVVLGRGVYLQPQRVAVAANLWQAGRAERIFVSGAGEASQMIQQLEASGVSPQSLDGESCSRTTAENAEYTAAQLKSEGIQKILLVTDAPHMLRSLLTFRNAGFDVIPHPSPLPPNYAGQPTRFLVLRESIGFVSYGLLGRY